MLAVLLAFALSQTPAASRPGRVALFARDLVRTMWLSLRGTQSAR